MGFPDAKIAPSRRTCRRVRLRARKGFGPLALSRVFWQHEAPLSAASGETSAPGFRACERRRVHALMELGQIVRKAVANDSCAIFTSSPQRGRHCHKQTRFRYDPHAAIPINVTHGRLPHAAVYAGLHCGGNGKRNAAPVRPAPCAANFTGNAGEGGRRCAQGEVFRLDARRCGEPPIDQPFSMNCAGCGIHSVSALDGSICAEPSGVCRRGLRRGFRRFKDNWQTQCRVGATRALRGEFHGQCRGGRPALRSGRSLSFGCPALRRTADRPALFDELRRLRNPFRIRPGRLDLRGTIRRLPQGIAAGFSPFQRQLANAMPRRCDPRPARRISRAM